MPLNLARRYGDPQFSDVELVYEVLAADDEPADAPHAAMEPPVKRRCTRLSIQTLAPVGSSSSAAPASPAAGALLKMVPGHMLVLAEIPYLENQVRISCSADNTAGCTRNGTACPGYNTAYTARAPRRSDSVRVEEFLLLMSIP
jgi:hypothetical protein